jgi:hypothetical protein
MYAYINISAGQIIHLLTSETFSSFPAINADTAPSSVSEAEPLLGTKTEDNVAVNLNHLEDVFEGYDLDLARVIVGANPLVAFFTGLLVMGVMLGTSFVIHNTDREKHCT